MITDEMKINSAISTLKSIQPFYTNQGLEITNKMCGINTLIWNYKQIANKICKINIDYFFPFNFASPFRRSTCRYYGRHIIFAYFK